MASDSTVITLKSTRDPNETSNSTLIDEDVALLASLGYKQEFKRVFSKLEVFGIGFSIIGVLPSMASVLVYSIPNGGASAMVWGWATCGIFLMFIALAMAELGSIAPTSGGLYYWTFMFSSPRWRCYLSWIVAYSNTIANISALASVDWGCSRQIMAAVSIASGRKFETTTAQTFGLYCALLLSHGFICGLNPAIIARLQTPYVVVNILLCLAIAISLPAVTPSEFMNNAEYAFGDFTNLTGWSDGYAFILSFLSPLWTIGAFDATVHISEEARNANVAIPFAIVLAAFSSAVLGWAVNVALAFCMGNDLESIINNPIGHPMATILFNSLGQKGTLVIWLFIVIVQYTMGSSLTTCSRQIFAFARDGGMPLSQWLYNVDHRTHSPITCVWFAVFLSFLLGLLAFAGDAAIGAVFSLVVVGQYVAYSIPIVSRFLIGKEIKRGPFSLGCFSLPVAIVAVTWMAFITVVFFFPLNPNPKATDMNYAVVVFGGTLLMVTAYFYMPKYGGRYWFKGPINTLNYAPEIPDGNNNSQAEKEHLQVQ
ncbi:hypothetical protein AMATHDRAFT_150477 [Amanita thiersii Skay4041]|uniref:Amino acid permease/ SLC12A domain-containing protein n=1 Tax=Amanita thiersii Skay4041 TaxID=703135 RepID=A0A2A9NC42_9AGAR|nr:hypothetical protein AMATHDRAFT_150477 [Amanita thiersii Skay4041]